MIRRLGEESPAFVLDTAGTTYAFRVLPSGHLEQLYYGARIAVDDASLDALTEKRVFEPGNVVVYSPEHKTTVLEDLCLEFSAPGHGDLREPFAELVAANGARSSDFLFSSAEIADGAPARTDLPGAYGASEHLAVTLTDGDLTLRLFYTVYPECDCICRSAVLLNGGDSPVQLERLMSLQLDLPRCGMAVTSFHGAWTREMGKSTVTLPAGKFVVESRAGCSSSRANPFFMLHDPAATETAGDCYGFNLIYSGNHYAAVEVSAFGKTRVVTGVQPQGFRWQLEPGERFETPEAVMTYSPAGFSGQSRNMHAFVREHIVRGEWKGKTRPILLNSWEAGYFNISESSLVSLAQTGKELGMELFVMDDGWFGERSDDSRSLGDWTPNPKKLPNGLAGLAKKINALGMQLGIWVEPEMVNVQSKLYEAHSDWVMQIPDRLHSEGRNQRVLDLANPAVVDWLIETMTGVFSSAEIAYVKWDMNRVFSDTFSPYLPPERQGETAHRYILGLYRLMGALIARFPHILFEGCASGGNRFDLGILCYFPQIWASDNTDALCRVKIQEGYSYGYPLDTVAAHVSNSPNHQTLRVMPLDTRFAVAAFGLLGYEYDLRDLRPKRRKQIAGQIETYKQWREVLQHGDFHRGRSGDLHEWTCVSKDGKRAVGLLVQELTQPNTQFAQFFPRGLDPDRTYRLWSEEKRVNVKHFGSLVNTVAPIHVRQDSLVHNVIAAAMTMPGEHEDVTASGGALMQGGVKLKQAYSGTGYGDDVRYFPDFAARLYFMEAVEA